MKIFQDDDILWINVGGGRTLKFGRLDTDTDRPAGTAYGLTKHGKRWRERPYDFRHLCEDIVAGDYHGPDLIALHPYDFDWLRTGLGEPDEFVGEHPSKM